MWIFMNDAFLSIVDPAATYSGGKGAKSRRLLVRARFKGDISRVFPHAKVSMTPDRDYRYRAMIDRRQVAEAMAKQVEDIDYKNFKGSTNERWRHDAYSGCWSVMESEQRIQHLPKKARQKVQEEFWPDDPYGDWPVFADDLRPMRR